MFQYLGVTLGKQGLQDIEIKEKLGEVMKFYYARNNNFISNWKVLMETKMKIFNMHPVKIKYTRRTLGSHRRTA